MSDLAGHARRLPLVLRNPSFGKVWAGQVLSQAASRMYQVGAVWWLVGVAGGDHRGLDSGLFLMVSSLPAIVLAPVVARLVARHAHRTVLATTAAAAGVLSAATAVWARTAALPVIALYAAGLALAVCQAVFDPCLTTSVPELVEDADIEAATAFELSTQSLAGLAGGLLGPLVVDAGGPAGVVAGCAGAYLSAALLIVSARFPRAAAGDGPAGEAAPRTRTLRHVLAGLPFVRRVLLCFTAANVFTTAVYVVMPLYTRGTLHATGSTAALLEAALGAGTLVGSFTGGRVPGRPITVGSGCLAAMAAALALPGLCPGHVVAVGSLLVVGWCVGVVGVRFVALFQRQVPAEDKPGFFAVMQALLGATFPVASLLFGALGDHLTARTLCLVQGAGLLPVTVALWRLRGPADNAVPPRPDRPARRVTPAGDAS
ncbi:MFS transporter [Streptomyces anandii]|uniref:MFS transporter n=1 Tax=Streptomyces anandii TaxID=285454 RepID=UPI0037AD132C